MRFCVHNVKTQKHKEVQRKSVFITTAFRMLNLVDIESKKNFAYLGASAP